MHEVKILKEMGKGLGLNIASWSSPDGVSCVVINSIEKDGPAYMDGRLKKGENKTRAMDGCIFERCSSVKC